MSWFTERRLDFIDWCLSCNAGVRRADLVKTFGISVPKASTDLKEFQRLYPKAMKYDATAKMYVPAKTAYKEQRDAPAGINWNFLAQ